MCGNIKDLRTKLSKIEATGIEFQHQNLKVTKLRLNPNANI